MPRALLKAEEEEVEVEVEVGEERGCQLFVKKIFSGQGYGGADTYTSVTADTAGPTSPTAVPNLGIGPISNLFSPGSNHVAPAPVPVPTGNRSQSSSSSGSGERVTPISATHRPQNQQAVSAGIQENHHSPSNPLSPQIQSVAPLPTAGLQPPSGLLPPSVGPPLGPPSSVSAAPSLIHYPGASLNHFFSRAPGANMPHMGKRHSCKLCTAMFDSKAELQMHTQVHMREAKPYKCTQCVKSFANSSYLSQHMRIHLGIKPFGPCQYCGRKFTQLSHLQQHLRTHTGEKPYRCKISGCEKAFSQLSNLQSHTRCHQTDKPYKCNSCYKCFTDEQSLLDHIPKHKESKHLKIHICPYCGKSYTQSTYLAKHMTKHADRRDRDVRLREMMRTEDQLGWPRDVGGFCAVHGIADSCADTLAASANLPFNSFAGHGLMSSETCGYTPTGISSNMAAAQMAAGVAAADSSAFRHLGLLGRAGFTSASASSRNPYNFPYDNFRPTAHSGLTPSAGTPYNQLIRLDRIGQYAGQAATSDFQNTVNMLKRDTSAY